MSISDKFEEVTGEILSHHKIVLTVQEIDVIKSISCGLRTGWLTGEDDETGLKCDMKCGAGAGSPWILIKVNGRIYRIDGRDLMVSVVRVAQEQEAEESG